MKRTIQILLALAIFVFIIVFSAFSANAASPDPAAPQDSELPPDIFDEHCDGGASCPGRAFLDMPPAEHWAHLPIDWALTRHITAGTGPSSFSPELGCTRAQAVTFLWRAAGSPTPQSGSCPFLDVPADAYYRSAVIWAKEQGITSGSSEVSFSPDAVCQRAQIITFLWRAKGSPIPESDSLPFRDVSESAYYRDAVAWAIQHHVTTGTSSVSFSPGATCTRAQIVTFLYQANRAG